ncbi:MAG: tRNA pseudouridine(38-40) synthase TruA [Parasporobacterium sp.]|nr:tRNA pseudouridine(38-40) synthase TruA [Parasporobacterium sp.]
MGSGGYLNYKMEISYDGTRYYGWERQPDKDTIQGKLESVLSVLNGTSVEVIGAGRTDAGVHARKMTANVRLETELSPEGIRDYMNHYLPDDICVNKLVVASDRFHARYNAMGKLYTYTCYVGEEKPVFDRRYVTVLDFSPDVEKMREAAGYLTGTHDFRAFCANPKMKKSTVRCVDSIEILRKKDRLYLNFHGNGFLQNMVRIMTGTLLQVGEGRIPPERVREILEGLDRREAGPTAPAKGLCLMKVDY